jgi:hypothetical protein
MVFWSKQSPGFEQYLKQVQEQQALYPNIFDVFSFNLDELPDAGAATLRSLGLEWTVMRLPGGRQSQTYRTYAQKDPLGILVNAFGHAVLAPAVVRQDAFKIDDARVSHDRYLAQLQSLFIGDFLVAGWESSFAPPFRYRLTPAEALAHYTKTAQQQQATDRRIISLLGMWNLTGDPKHLDQAVEESRTASSPDLVTRFCLAKHALRQGDAKPEAVLSALVQESGGAPAAFAAAAILALEAQSKELHEFYRGKFFDAAADTNPALWPVASFLRDRYHRYHLFKGNFTKPEDRGVRSYIVNLSAAPSTERLPTIELKTLDGKTLSLPKDTNGKLTLLVFIESPDVVETKVELDARGKPIKKKTPLFWTAPSTWRSGIFTKS